MSSPPPAPRAHVAVAAAVGAMLGATTSTPAQELVEVHVTGAVLCDAARSLERQAADAPGHADVRVAVDIARHDELWSAEIDVSGPLAGGKRRLTGASCAEVGEAAGFIIGLIVEDLEREAQLQQAADLAAAEESPAAPPVATVDRSPTSAEAGTIAARTGQVAISASALVGADISTLPTTVPALAATAELGGTRWSLRATAMVSGRATELLPAGEAEADYRALALGVQLCREAVGELVACVGAERSLLRVTPRRASVVSEQTASWNAGVASLELTWPLSSRLAISARGDALFASAGPAVELDGSEVHRVPDFGLRAWLGMRVDFVTDRGSAQHQ